MKKIFLVIIALAFITAANAQSVKVYKDGSIIFSGEAVDSVVFGKDTSDSDKSGATSSVTSTTELDECIVAAYNHIRMEGTYARVGYNIDVMRGDEAWNCSQVWYLPFDDLNEPTTDDIGQWSWRDWYYTINVCNYILKTCENLNYVNGTNTTMDRIKGQALFLRGLSYYNLANYYQNPPLITDYDTYSSSESLNVANGSADNPNAQYDLVLDQVESDFLAAVSLLPSKNEGGEWASGRATSGAAAGYLARALMQRHKYAEALPYLRAIINGNYGSYRLMDNFGDNFREGTAYENNAESLFEVQYLDKDSQGIDDEWTSVNTSKNSSQGSAIESNFAPGNCGGWGDIAASPWLYNLYKAEKTKENSLDPRIYWTLGTYESEWDSQPDGTLGNVCYTRNMSSDGVLVNNTYGGIPIAKWTHMRTGEYSSVVTGLHDGINLRLMRFSDVLLRAAECINEVYGPTAEAIEYINIVRRRAKLNDLNLSTFSTADMLFEQIANVERPKEFACEYGRGNDLLRWGFFYDEGRLNQIKQHGSVRLSNDITKMKDAVDYSSVASDSNLKCTFDTYIQGHEFLPIYQGTLDGDASLVGNSANNSTSNADYFKSKGWKVHPVTSLP